MIFLAVPRHQQQKQNHNQVTGFKVSGKELPEKGREITASDAILHLDLLRLGIDGDRLFWLRRREGMGCGWRGGLGFRHPLSLVGAVRLRNISIIHGNHLPG